MGIGLAIAKRAAQDGANIVIGAKTTSPHPKLPGTIYTAAAECEALGGKALAVPLDIMDDEATQRFVDAAVGAFGGIDILVNNASAIDNSGTLDMKAKKYALMHNINGRGTFWTSKLCLPRERLPLVFHHCSMHSTCFLTILLLDRFAKVKQRSCAQPEPASSDGSSLVQDGRRSLLHGQVQHEYVCGGHGC